MSDEFFKLLEDAPMEIKMLSAAMCASALKVLMDYDRRERKGDES